MAGELILIVEDHEKNRKLVRDVLQVKGYRTVETETAEEGIRVARESGPALILMDIQLPGMDGIAALKLLRTDPLTRDIPVIAVTAMTGMSRVSGSVRSSFNAAIPSIPGSWMSMRIRAGPDSRATRIPSSAVSVS